MAEDFFRVRKGLSVANATNSANLDPITLIIGALTANSTLVNAAAVNVTGRVNTATFYAATSANVGTQTVNSIGAFISGTVNTDTHSVGTLFTANSTLVNSAAVNVTGRVNTATFYAATTANVGSVQINTTAVIVGTSVVNATSINAAAIFVNGQAVLTATVADQTITGGAKVTELDLGTISSGTVTPDPGDRPMQIYTNNGAHTLAPGSNLGAYYLTITNGATAGAITTSGWNKVVGDSFVTTNGYKFRCGCSIGAGGSLLQVQAMQ